MTTMIHMTDPANLASILRSGLVGGRPATEWSDDTAWTLDWYDFPPLFLSSSDSLFMGMVREVPCDRIELAVDATDLPMVADLASLVDYGARYDPDGFMRWRLDRIPEVLFRYTDEYGAVEISSLLDPDTDVARAAIALTGTCVVEKVPLDRIVVPAPPQMVFGR